jgi:hypothetical protein
MQKHNDKDEKDMTKNGTIFESKLHGCQTNGGATMRCVVGKREKKQKNQN